jgi:hypothetical protein
VNGEFSLWKTAGLVVGSAVVVAAAAAGGAAAAHSQPSYHPTYSKTYWINGEMVTCYRTGDVINCY